MKNDRWIAVRKYVYLMILLIVIAGCSNNDKLPSTFSDQDINIGMEVQNVSEQSLTLHMYNEGSSTVGYGYWYSIEALQSGRWVELPFIQELAFLQSRVLLPPNDRHESTISLEDAELIPGQQYRMIKTFGTEYGEREFTLAVEFSVGDSNHLNR